ncbi:hypothetical protein APHAL10511_006813 [Amanita phalloides]|nr:hypothetical protein APHAL10511_006813 [Amanita phalloides]
MMKVIVTGASGVLGSAVYDAFQKSGHDVIGLSHSRGGKGLIQLDLTDEEEVDKLFERNRPEWVIHCAAERRPDVAEKNVEGTRKLNVVVPGHLASLSERIGFTLVYISTDYVFDGTSPPYLPTSPTNPLQLYGQTKRDGELAVLGKEGAKSIVLRVPVLYGPAPKNSDSAINILLDVVLDQSGKTYKMDHYATRYPTNVVDIANFLVRMSALQKPMPPIMHYSGAEPYTKYEMCLVFAKLLGVSHKHIIAEADPPSGAGATKRPRDCQLYTGGVAPLPAFLHDSSFLRSTTTASNMSSNNDEKVFDVQDNSETNQFQRNDTSLPSPVSATLSKSKPKLSAAAIIPVWIVLSSSVIIYNYHLYNSLNFKYPVFLVTWHLSFAAIGTRILQRTTPLLDGAKDVHMTRETFVRSILPIGLLFSGSLILSNTAYLYLSVAYIQMLKAFTPVAILLISWTFRIQDPNKKLALIVLMISSGVALASHGELKFNLIGFITQAAAVGFEASRLVMIQILLHNLKMDPLVSLHYYAPVCAVINLIFLPFTEGLAPFRELSRLGAGILISNAAVAFCLNVAAVFLVGVASSLVLTLAGVFKDILLITGSVLIFGSTVTPLQIFGYSIALCGLVLFKTSGGK